MVVVIVWSFAMTYLGPDEEKDAEEVYLDLATSSNERNYKKRFFFFSFSFFDILLMYRFYGYLSWDLYDHAVAINSKIAHFGYYILTVATNERNYKEFLYVSSFIPRGFKTRHQHFVFPNVELGLSILDFSVFWTYSGQPTGSPSPESGFAKFLQFFGSNILNSPTDITVFFSSSEVAFYYKDIEVYHLAV